MTRIKKLFSMAAALAATAVLATATPAAAAGTYLSVGSSTSGTHIYFSNSAGAVQFPSGWPPILNCGLSGLNGALFAGTEVTTGETIGQVQNAWFASCTMGSSMNVTANGTWPIVVTGDPALPNDPIPAELDVSLMVTTPGIAPYACEVLVEGSVDILIHMGPASGFNGRIEIDTTTGAPPLHVQAFDGNGNPAVSTCAGQVFTGDIWDMDADYNLTSSGNLGHS